MKQLDPKEIKKLGSFMSGTAQISRDEEEAVISEFQTASATGGIQFQGKEFIKTVLTKALGPDKAARIIESMTQKSYPGLEALKWVDVKTLTQMLKVEHAQTVAVVLAHGAFTGLRCLAGTAATFLLRRVAGPALALLRVGEAGRRGERNRQQ
jgi:flagellar motor switch protein FliG